MKNIKPYLFIIILLLAVFVISADSNGSFEFPVIMVVLMNLIIVPPLVQWIKKITEVREIRAIIAAALSFLSAIIGIILAKQGSFAELWKLLVLAYSVSQIAYNLWWNRLLQPKKQ